MTHGSEKLPDCWKHFKMPRKVNDSHSKEDDKKPFGTVTVAGRGKKLHHLLDAYCLKRVAKLSPFFQNLPKSTAIFF